MGAENAHSQFRENYSLEKRKKMQHNALKKYTAKIFRGSSYILTVMEKDVACPKYPLLKSNLFLLEGNLTLIGIET